MSKENLIHLKTLEDSILNAIVEIADLLSHQDTQHVETANHFGDKQLKIDVLSDEIMFKHLKESKKVKYALSEEEPELHEMDGEHFIVTFDPLDGSSIIDVNWAVGTIWAIWPADEHKLIGFTGKKMVSSGIALYGPRTTVAKYNAESDGVEELTLKRSEAGKTYWCKTKDKIKVAEKTKIFAPANLRATSDNKQYEELFEFWRKNKYTLRYSGGLVPDIYQIFLRENGVFANPHSSGAPAKLRFLYEVAPVAFLMEKAGGKTTNGNQSILDIEIDSYVMKSALCLGSSEEVSRFEKVLGGH